MKKNKYIRPCIGITSRDFIVMETATTVACAAMYMQANFKHFGYRHVIQGKGRTEGARNEICENALGKDRTHLLFIDADCSFNPLTVMPDIFKFAHLPICGANAKNSLNEPVFKCDINRQPLNYITDKPIEVDSIGMHLTLIDLSILKKIPKPWFYAPPKEDGSNEIISEDVAFCRKARKYGFKSYLHHTTSIYNMHWKRFPLSMYDVAQKQMEEAKGKLK